MFVPPPPLMVPIFVVVVLGMIILGDVFADDDEPPPPPEPTVPFFLWKFSINDVAGLITPLCELSEKSDIWKAK